MDEAGEPAVEKVLASYGLPHDHTLVKLEVIDVWRPTLVS